jgi:hypothetical protein
LNSVSITTAATLDSIDALIEGVQYLQTTFVKPSLVTDFGLSSYPSSSYERRQELAVDTLFKRIGELKERSRRDRTVSF